MNLEVNDIRISRDGETPMARVVVSASKVDQNGFDTRLEILVAVFDLSLNAEQMAAVAVDQAKAFLAEII